MTDVTVNKLGEEPLTQEGKFEGQKLEEIVVNKEALEVFEFEDKALEAGPDKPACLTQVLEI